jgi:phosphocarrier protein HPr
MSTREVTIGSRVGLHARPAALFVQAASAAGVPVTISKAGGKAVDARSILGVLALGAKNGEAVTLEADGDGADAVLDSLVALLEQDLDEPASAGA